MVRCPGAGRGPPCSSSWNRTGLADAWTYFREEQSACGQQYVSFIGPDDPPPIELNEDIMARYRPLLEPF